jgi:hypothetical protein
LSNGDNDAGFRSIRQTCFKQISLPVPPVSGGSLDRNPPRLLIFFAEGNSTMRPTGAEHRRHAKADG